MNESLIPPACSTVLNTYSRTGGAHLLSKAMSIYWARSSPQIMRHSNDKDCFLKVLKPKVCISRAKLSCINSDAVAYVYFFKGDMMEFCEFTSGSDSN